jgi:hypothetical protein
MEGHVHKICRCRGAVCHDRAGVGARLFSTLTAAGLKLHATFLRDS